MHTVMVVLGGFLLLGICLLAGRLMKTMAIAALINLWEILVGPDRSC